MHGRDLGVNPDDLVETPQVEQEAKQEILENKDVSLHARLKPKESQMMHVPTEGQKCVNINNKIRINLLFYEHNTVCCGTNVVKSCLN